MGSETYASGTTPQINDTRRKLQVKEILATKAIVTGDISGVTGVYSGNGAPAGDLIPSGSALYVDLNNGSLYYWNTDTSEWL